MRRLALILTAAFLVTGTAWAQQKPIVPMTAVSESKALSGKTKVLYLMRQLELNPDQRENVRGLIDAILDSGAEQDISLEEIYSLMAQVQEAEAAGDKDRITELTKELRSRGKKPENYDEFFMNLERLLTDQQKKLLKEARARLERNPSGALRPVDILRAAEKLDLNEEQRKHVEQVRQTARHSLRSTQKLKDKERFQVINGILGSIISKLTPEQEQAYGESIAKLRPDLAYRMRVLTPEQEAVLKERQQQRKNDNSSKPEPVEE